MVLVVVFAGGERRGPAEEVPPVPGAVQVVEIREEPTPAPELDPRLAAARDALDRGDPESARTAVEGITPEELEGFSAEERSIWE